MDRRTSEMAILEDYNGRTYQIDTQEYGKVSLRFLAGEIRLAFPKGTNLVFSGSPANNQAVPREWESPVVRLTDRNYYK
jgi:hypothetical protein